MAMNDVRLPRSIKFVLSNTEELWLRDTHLLCVRYSFGTETYQRFDYRDIESVSVVRTKTWLWFLGLWLLPVLFLIDRFIEVDGLPPWVLLFAVPFVILLFLNGRDRTCRTELRTRVNTRRLSSLSRVSATRRAVGMLCERIRAAQDGVAADGPGGDAAPREDARLPEGAEAPPPLPRLSSLFRFPTRHGEGPPP